MRIRKRLDSAGRDHGAASLEYTGVILVVALVVALVAAAVIGTQPAVRDGLGRAVCQILTLGQGECGDTPVADPHRPTEPCDVNSTKTSQGYAATVGIVHGGHGQEFEYAEMSDGRVRITRLDDHDLGVEVGVGVGASASGFGRKVGARRVVSASADLSLRAGQVWYTDEDSAMNFFSEVRRDGTERLVLGNGSKRAVWNAGEALVNRARGKKPTPIGTPDEIFYEGGVKLSASGEFSKGEGISGAVGASDALGYRQSRNGETTVYLHSTVSAEVALQLRADASGPLPETYGGDQTVDLVTAVAFDRNSQPTNVMTTVDLDGTASRSLAAAAKRLTGVDGETTIEDHTVYTANLPLNSDQDRGTALRYLAATGIGHIAVATAKVDLVVPAAPLVVGATSDYLDAVRDRGQLTRQGFTDDPTYDPKDFGLSVDASAGPGVGVGVEYSQSSQLSTSADYWNGQAWTAWPGCVR